MFKLINTGGVKYMCEKIACRVAERTMMSVK